MAGAGSRRDDDVIGPIRSAVEADPSNHDLRLHLAQLLIEAGEAHEALDQCTSTLAQVPDHDQALRLAARAAEAAGDEARATRFRRLLQAITSPGTGQKAAKGRLHEPPADEPGEVVKLHALSATEAANAGEHEHPAVTLDDIAGMDHVKRRLRTAFLGPLENPALRRMYRKSLRGGLLLYGPPGCGKTFIARATAGELGARFVAIGLHDVLDLWFGESESHVHEIFEDARRNAPCVLFFDEVDALGRKRSHLRHHGGYREVVVQFLSELDGFAGRNEGVFVLAATNHPWDVDTALRRPGRLDRMLLVLPPDKAARRAILSFHLRNRPLGNVDLSGIVAETEFYSGADLAHICETAAEYALESSIETGTPRPIETSDLERALSEVSPSTLQWLEMARNYVEFADASEAYGELRNYMRTVELL